MSEFANKLQNLSNIISKPYLIIIFPIGLIGNIFNTIIFSRHSLRLNSCSLYFLSISFFHIIVLIIGCLFRLINLFLGYDLSSTSLIFCKFRAYIVVVGYVISRHLLCLISIDRWMITSTNIFIHRQCNRKTTQLIIIISIIFWLLIEIFIPIGFYIENNNCIPSLNPFYLFMYRIIDLLCTLFPFFILIIFTCLLLKNLLRNKIFPNTNHPIVISSSLRMNDNQYFLRIVNTYSRKYTNKDYHLIRLCFFQVIVFILLNLPAASYSLYSYITRMNIKTINHLAIDSFLNAIVSNLAYTHCALTFYLYTMTSKKFRKECYLIYFYIQRRLINRFQ
ncbi:unnamed protein product [Rotaria sp. Silwood1]|nr:unnamed protein product [Rotaria sp. Silwood1]CAF3955626.1 unnamed protein product [Rotaria sp. Silwood1]CAF5018145.1 unnamed protein product [Rotaria sp. Silwood1]